MRIFEYLFCLNGKKCLTLYGVVKLFENKIKTIFDVSDCNLKHIVATILDFSASWISTCSLHLSSSFLNRGTLPQAPAAEEPLPAPILRKI